MIQPALLPPYERLFGPVTHKRVLRLLAIYAAMVVAGWVLVANGDRHGQAFGLGLILPGGGFLAHYDPGRVMGLWHLAAAGAALALFAVALGGWFGTGNILLPPLVWLGAAVWAAGMNHGAVRPYAAVTVFGMVCGLAAGLSLVALVRIVWARRQRARDNAWLVAEAPALAARFRLVERADELSFEDLKRLRFALDRALQPLNDFNGFEWLDPFQTAAVRYQLNFLAYAVAMTQARFLPAFDGYMDEAQIRLIDKQADRRVWGYWRIENLWGNLRWDPNPVGRENIMFTGFVALQMALFTTASGRDDFSAPGRLAFNGFGRSYAFTDADFMRQLEGEYDASAFYLIACEPNWVYPLCNTIGASALKAHDPARWQGRAADFRRNLETEFLDAFGRYVPCRSARTGLALPAIGGAMPLAMPCFFLNAIAPDIALRQWLLLRRRLFDGQGRFRRSAFWPIDTGNYGFSRASAYTAGALAAAELGDGAVYEACLTALDSECPSVEMSGVTHRPKASVWAHGVELMARAAHKDGFRDLLSRRPVAGPRLEGVPYPDVLVAGAYVVGDVLTAVLYPGGEDGRFDMRVTGLTAGRAYRINGAPASADGDGVARFALPVSGRTELRVEPA